MIKDQAPSAASLLVLENADISLVLEGHNSTFSGVPMLVTSTNPAISSLASSTNYSFNLLESADYPTVNNLVSSIQMCFNPCQHIITLVANGGSGKTQVVLQFVSKNAFRWENILFIILH